MRGAQYTSGGGTDRDGIIPAYAGSTLAASTSRMPRRDHPRVCGEHLTVHEAFDNLPGSSPRMRGAQLRQAGGRRLRGIIPAYAGSTSMAALRIPSRADHPRVCGEHQGRAGDLTIDKGSSPRMRGAPDRPHGVEDGDGIIPAYAGSTRADLSPLAPDGDHPRVCGEHSPPPRCGARRPGSSPRMRGARDDLGGPLDGDGIIPAYAGSTAT